ncbi:MAG: hypothetical protein Q9168_006664 [Polycauliona sp. 1 TL-2023]
MYFPTLHPLLEQPPTPCVLSLIQYVLVLGFTSKSSPFRFLGAVPMLSYIFLALRNAEIHHDTIPQLFLIMSMGGTATFAFQYLDSALLSRWTYSAQGPTSDRGGQKNLQSDPDTQRSSGPLTSKLVFGWEEAFRARSVSSPWEVPNVPRFYPTDKHPNRLPTKAQFLSYAALRCLISFCLLDLVGWMGRDASMNTVNFASERIPLFARWRDVTGEELVVRYFWHQSTRQKFVAPAHLLTFSVLRIPHDALLARYAVLALTFVFSGIFHQLADVAAGVPWSQGGLSLGLWEEKNE